VASDQAERARRIAAGADLLRHVLAQPDPHPNLLRRVLLEVFWFVSESDGKYTTRYQSAGALALKAQDPTAWRAQRRHEHVFTRRSMTERLSAGEDPASVLADAHGCIVTKAEHDLLTPFDLTRDGWDRYRAAGIAVVDTDAGMRFI